MPRPRRFALQCRWNALVAVACSALVLGATPGSVQADDWMPAGPGITRGISGLEVLAVPGAETGFLVLHDNKVYADGASPEPRFALITRRDGKIGYQAIPWPAKGQPDDLEALAAIPGQPRHFAALTSKGRLYEIALDPTATSLQVLHEQEIPNPDKRLEFEALEIVRLGEITLAVWGDRGTTEQLGRIYWAPINLATFAIDASKLQSADFRAPWPSTATRHIADFKIDPAGTLFIASTSDPGDEGPFVSAVYAAGNFRVTEKGPELLLNPKPTRLYITKRHKIEGLALWPGAGGGLVLGSDDENFGGALRLPEE